MHWYLLCAIAIIVLQGKLLGSNAHRKLSYKRSFSKSACMQGEQLEMAEEIVNAKLLPVPWLRVESLLHPGLVFKSQSNLEISSGQHYQNHKSFFSLLPYTKITRRHQVHCMQRGAYRINSVALTAGDLFGMFNRSQRIEIQEQLLVYPKPYGVAELGMPSHSYHGDALVRRFIVEDPFMVAGVREYRAGDPLKRVNWNASARTGKLQVQQLDYTAHMNVMILLNLEDHAGMWTAVNNLALIEFGISYAAGIAEYVLQAGMEVGFAANGYLLDDPLSKPLVEPGGGAMQMELINQVLAKLTIAQAMPFQEMLEAVPGYCSAPLLIAISAFDSQPIQDAIERLRGQGYEVELLLFRELHESLARRKAGEPA